MVTLDDVRSVAMALPGVEEGTSHGTPAWKVKGIETVAPAELEEVVEDAWRLCAPKRLLQERDG